MDKAGQKYWNELWADGEVPSIVDPRDTRLANRVNRRFHHVFQRLFAGYDTSSMRLLEIGCGKSAWLPYFAKEFGFQVYGLDYSPIGCEMARAVLQANKIEAEVVCADFFSSPENLLGKFDVVVSFGVIEHFEDTSGCLRSVSSFLKTGGMLITSIPNMVGMIGAVQKMVNKPVYDIHCLIDPAMLKSAHENAGLAVLECDYFLSTSFGVNNLAGLSTRSPSGFLKRILLSFLARVSMLIWLIEEKIGDFPPSKQASPYINCIALKRS